MKRSIVCAVMLAGALFSAMAVAQAPAPVNATCKDGTTYSGKTRRGACAGHGGVLSLATSPSPTPAAGSVGAAAPTVAAPSPAPSTAAASSPPAASAAVNATCKDGTTYAGKTRRGACAGHGGVLSVSTSPPSAPAAAPVGAATPPAAAPATSTAATASASAAPAAVNATCKDGTTYSGKTRRGACAGHGGVLSLSATPTATAAPGSKPATTKATTTTATTPAPAATRTVTSPPAAAPPVAASSPAAPGLALAPAVAPAPTTPQAVPNATPASTGAPINGQVWVNPASKVYHCSGSRYFGKTKTGEYMTETDAKTKGFRAASGKACS